jgi:hypothetical protein
VAVRLAALAPLLVNGSFDKGMALGKDRNQSVNLLGQLNQRLAHTAEAVAIGLLHVYIILTYRYKRKASKKMGWVKKLLNQKNL